MGLMNLFPTPIYRDMATLENYDEVQIEVKTCLDKILAEDDLECVSYIYRDAGERKKNRPESGYLITDQLIEQHGLVKLKSRINEAVSNYIKLVNWSRLSDSPVLNTVEDIKFEIKNSWFNIQEKGVCHEWHCHPGYQIAGVYYMRVNADQGGIQFKNPNIIMQSCAFPEGGVSPQSIEFIPRDGDIVLFPAWLSHNTIKNTTDTPRISIAFNVDFCNL